MTKIKFQHTFAQLTDDSKSNAGALVSYSINTGILATIVAFFVGIFGWGKFVGAEPIF